MPTVDLKSIPQVPPGPTGDQIPDARQLALIQWLFEVAEDGYGPKSQAAVAALQRAQGILVDDAVMIGPRTWGFILAQYNQKVESLQVKVPDLPAGPTGDALPNPAQLAVIQWSFEISEEGYGSRTRAAVAALQQANGIPVDEAVMIGPRTWSLLVEQYRLKAAPFVTWELPAMPLRLDGQTQAEDWLRQQIDKLNWDQVPEAAGYYVRNLQIRQMEQAGQPLTTRVAVRGTDDPQVAQVAEQLRWTQAKVDRLWAKAGEIGLDPRVLLAILFQEGTGSFNTNGAVPVRFWTGDRYVRGGSGAQPDFEKDLAAAAENQMLAKLRAYGYYAAAFRQAAGEENLGDGNLFQFVNWNTVCVRSDGFEVRPGCYATHTEWWKGLQYYFDTLCGAGSTVAYSRYLAARPASVDSAVPAVRFGLTFNGTGATELETNRPWLEAFSA